MESESDWGMGAPESDSIMGSGLETVAETWLGTEISDSAIAPVSGGGTGACESD